MKTVHEVSALTGVSVRTLHHYDAIGLLKPTAVTDAGYRLYDDAALERLQTVLLFRELRFPLREIKAILDRPGFDRRQAFADQIRLLTLEREHIDRLIDLAREQMKGGDTMSFSAFDRSEIEQYAAEAKERWGDTAAWRESERRSAADKEAGAAGLDEIFRAFGDLRDSDPTAPAAQEKVDRLRDEITAHFYHCTEEILAGLGEMYVADERFSAHIDAVGGAGTAAFVADAIRARR